MGSLEERGCESGGAATVEDIEEKVQHQLSSDLFAQFMEHVRLAAPVIFTFVLRKSTDVLSVVAVGHISSHSLAAVGLATVTANVTGNSMIIGLSGALSTLCSQAFGAKDLREMNLSLQRSFFILGCMVCLPVTFLWCFSAPILEALGQDQEIAMDAQAYMRILIPALWSLACSMCIQNWLYAQSNTLPTAIITFVLALLHPLWLYVYIIHLDMGFMGAALAVSTTKLSEVLLLLVYITCCSTVLVDTEFCWSRECLRLRGWGPFLRLGLPNLLLLSEWWASEIVIFLAGALPGDADTHVATMSIYQNLLALCFMFPIGLHVAAATIVGNALGAQLPSKAATSSVLAPAITVAIMLLLVGTVLLPVGEQVGQLFTSDRAVLSELHRLVPVLCVYVVFDGLQTALTGVLKGMGRQAAAAPVVLLCYFVLGVPLAIFLSMGGGKAGGALTIAPWGLGMGILGLALGTLAATFAHAACFVVLVYFRTDWQQQVRQVQERAATQHEWRQQQEQQQHKGAHIHRRLPTEESPPRSDSGSAGPSQARKSMQPPCSRGVSGSIRGHGRPSRRFRFVGDAWGLGGEGSGEGEGSGKHPSARETEAAAPDRRDCAAAGGTHENGDESSTASWWDEISFLGPAASYEPGGGGGSITAIGGSSSSSGWWDLQQRAGRSISGALTGLRLLLGAEPPPSEYELVRTYTDSLSPLHARVRAGAGGLQGHSTGFPTGAPWTTEDDLDFDFL